MRRMKRCALDLKNWVEIRFISNHKDQKGIVVSAEVNPDYTLRPEPSEIVKELEALVM